MMGNLLALVVEDERGLHVIYDRLLQNEGYQVIGVTNGAEAIQLLHDMVPHLIFLDMLLPHVNGEKVVDFLRKSPAFHQTRVVIVSSNKQFDHLAGVLPNAEFILKPILPDRIRMIAREVLQQSAS